MSSRLSTTSPPDPIFNTQNWIAFGVLLVSIGALLLDVEAIMTYIFSAEMMQVVTPIFDSGWYARIVVLLMLATIVFIYLNIRHHYSNRYYWNTACPQCTQNQLKRLPRRQRHRIIGRIFRLPIRYYKCANCKWRGTRVDRAHL